MTKANGAENSNVTFAITSGLHEGGLSYHAELWGNAVSGTPVERPGLLVSG
jgi:hypothetical protein